MERYPKAYIEYLQHFHRTRDFFECHEVLEAYWKENPSSPYRLTWVGLIQVAVALYHERRGNLRGAQKMMSSAINLLNAEHLTQLGMDAEKFLQRLKNRIASLQNAKKVEYQNIDIPLLDPALEEHVKPAAAKDAVDPYYINKHLLRDRTEVIEARQAELRRRAEKS